MKKCRSRGMLVWLLAMVPLLGTGCGLPLTEIQQLINDAANAINGVIGDLQEGDPSLFTDLPFDTDVDFDGEYIDDLFADLDEGDLTDAVLVGFENLTGDEIYVTYYVDGNEESIYVLVGETVLIEYDCIFSIDLEEETDFDPDTGELVATYDLSSISYLNPDDFECGYAFIITIDDEGVIGEVVDIDLDDPYAQGF